MAIYAVKEMGSMQAGYCSIGHGPNIVKCWAMEDILRGSRLVASGDSGGEKKNPTVLPLFHVFTIYWSHTTAQKVFSY